jgi:hypothetical protein
VSGSNLFVLNGNTIGEYTTSGATVNASLITGLGGANSIAIASSTVPVPPAIFLFAPGLAGLAAMRRRFKI